jgi:hypothetical protein
MELSKAQPKKKKLCHSAFLVTINSNVALDHSDARYQTFCDQFENAVHNLFNTKAQDIVRLKEKEAKWISNFIKSVVLTLLRELTWTRCWNIYLKTSTL